MHRVFVPWVEGAVDLAFVLKIENVAMSVQPARPFVSEHRHEFAWAMMGFDRVANELPQFWMLIEKLDAPMVVVCERYDVEPGDLSRIGEIVVGGSGSIREFRMAVDVRPTNARNIFFDDNWVRGRLVFELLSLTTDRGGRDPVDAGLSGNTRNALAPAFVATKFNACRQFDAVRCVEFNNGRPSIRIRFRK